MNPILIQLAVQNIQKYFPVTDQPESLPREKPDMDWLKEKLAEVIQEWLTHDFEKLLQVMYRIDVDEQKLGQALSTEHPAGNMATLVIERELQKVASRRKYSSRKKD